VKEGQFAGVWPGNEAFFNEMRGKGGLIGVAIDPLISHECGNSRYLAIPWLDACLTARLPKKERRPAERDAEGRRLARPDHGRRGDGPRPSGRANRLKGGWLPNETVAKRWAGVREGHGGGG